LRPWAGIEACAALRREAGSRQPGHRDHARGQLVLHVHGPAAVEVVAVDDGIERRVRPVARVGGHDVQVPDQRQRRAAAGARDARDQVGPVRITGDQLAADPGCRQVVAQDHRRSRLAAGRVGRVDPDQPLAQVQDLGARVVGVQHGPHPDTWPYSGSHRLAV